MDVQDDRLEWSLIGWGMGDESYVLRHFIIHADPGLTETWTRLKSELTQIFMREDGAPLKIQAAGIDSGGSHTASVYEFAKANRARKLWAFKGRSNVQSKQPIFPKRAKRTKGSKGAILYNIGVDTAKERIYSWLRQEEPGPGYVHFSYPCDEDYFEQLTAERVSTKYKNGFPYLLWKLPSGKRNEALDCFVYATAARYGLNVNMERLAKMNRLAADRAIVKTDQVQYTDSNSKIEVDEIKKQRAVRRPARKRSGYMSGINAL